jgi:hypothetical protein
VVLWSCVSREYPAEAEANGDEKLAATANLKALVLSVSFLEKKALAALVL